MGEVAEVQEGRRGGRAARRQERMATPIVKLPVLESQIPLYEILNAEGVEMIHDASMKMLEEVGIDFRDDQAPAQWKAAGADVDGQRVRIDRGLLMELISTAPETITMHARSGDTYEFGQRKTVFIPTYGSPYVMDFENERRYSTLDDLHKFHKLAYMSPAMHITGGITCEPVDSPVPRRHLHIAYSLMKHSDKPFMGAVTARENAQDSVDMAKIVFGDEFVRTTPVMASICNCNSPLLWDQTMLDAIRVYAANNQPVVLAPFVLAGASTSASVVGAVAQINAEALAGVAYMQIVNKGCPAIYGQFLATVSMKSGAPMAGTPEIAQMNFMVGQLARRYKLPWRSSGMIAGAKQVDAQAAYESIVTMFSVILSGANFAMHSAGWNEAGLCASFSKFVLDAEQVEMFYKMARGVDMSDLEGAMQAVREVGPGGHFLGTKHTQDNFETAMFIPELLDNNSFEQWLAEGARDTNTRGLEKAREMLDRYEAPALDPGVDEALLEYIARREAVLPDSVS